MVEELQNKLQNELEKLNSLQKEYSKMVTQRQRLDGQLNENTNVKQELELMKDGGEVYKLIGPVLVKQELEEAKQNVTKRMDYIKSELKRLDDVLLTVEKKMESQREVTSKAQHALQQVQMKLAVKA